MVWLMYHHYTNRLCRKYEKKYNVKAFFPYTQIMGACGCTQLTIEINEFRIIAIIVVGLCKKGNRNKLFHKRVNFIYAFK